MTDKAFKQVEEALEMKPQEEKEEKKETNNVEFNGHTDDINDDYIKMRKGIIDNLECAMSVIEKIQMAIEDSDIDNDRMLARKAEVFATLLKVSSDLRKDLFSLHKNKKELLEDLGLKNDSDENADIPANIKEFIIDSKESFDIEIEEE